MLHGGCRACQCRRSRMPAGRWCGPARRGCFWWGDQRQRACYRAADRPACSSPAPRTTRRSETGPTPPGPLPGVPGCTGCARRPSCRPAALGERRLGLTRPCAEAGGSRASSRTSACAAGRPWRPAVPQGSCSHPRALPIRPGVRGLCAAPRPSQRAVRELPFPLIARWQ